MYEPKIMPNSAYLHYDKSETFLNSFDHHDELRT